MQFLFQTKEAENHVKHTNNSNILYVFDHLISLEIKLWLYHLRQCIKWNGMRNI